MSIKLPVNERELETWRQKDFLYAVLDLPAFSSEADIRDRYRALSLIFHPDRQRDHNERKKEIATARFLEIQFAYEVLTDPFLRVIYDTLGLDGLRLEFPDSFRYLPKDEIYNALRDHRHDVAAARLQSNFNSRGTLTCLLDLRELFFDGWLANEWYTDLSERLYACRISFVQLWYSVSAQVSPNTRVSLASKIGQEVSGRPASTAALRGNVTGIIRHTYSPKLVLVARANLIHSRSLSFSSVYNDGVNVISATLPIRFNRSAHFPSSLNLSLDRRLFSDSLISGTLSCVIHRRMPSVYIGVTKPASGRKGDSIRDRWGCGIQLSLTSGAGLFAEYAFLLSHLSTDIRLAGKWSILGGLAIDISSAWQSEDGVNGVSTDIGWSIAGTQVSFDISYLGQKISLPITLMDEGLPILALVIGLVPTTGYMAWNYLSLKYMRKPRHLRRLFEQQASQEEWLTEKRREAQLDIELLTDTAQRALQTEKKNDGLVIIEASYYPVDDHDPLPDLGVNVTVPVQALVHKGQLFIPGGRSKSILRGFYDPLVGCEKRLSIHYYFHSRLHYAEFAEHTAVILPLQSHLVEST